MKKTFAKQNPVGAVVEIDPGQGNLSAKAYMASVVGPQRVAHAARRSYELSANKPTRIVSAAAASGQVSYASVQLPASDSGPSVVIFSSGAPGTNDGVSVRLINTLGAPGGSSYGAVLLPGEELYAQALTGTFNVVVGVSYF